jgi:glycine/D-amino acid oxidase-like deaminating enzyme
MKDVAVLGGGLQGCCIALALAERGVNVVLVDRNQRLLSRAAVANEGKIHIGYMYAGDPTLATARKMMQGALAFGPFFARHLGRDPESMTHSDAAVYAVHRDSQHDVAEVSGYLRAVHALLGEAAEGRERAYFGMDLRQDLRQWSAAEREAEFNGELVLGAFSTPETAINPVELSDQLRALIAVTPRIEVRLGQTVVSVVDEGERLKVTSQGSDGPVSDRFDQVVNALWDGRLAIDATLGLSPPQRWMHRFKYGVTYRRPAAERPFSATFISGPFGEVVGYRDGVSYLTWYPECMRATWRDITPPDIPTYADEPLRTAIIEGTFDALKKVVPSLAATEPRDLSEVIVRGGIIVAWGETDIDDPASELHNRFKIGVHSFGRYHSVDPGKLTMAPYFADICADRVAPRQ